MSTTRRPKNRLGYERKRRNAMRIAVALAALMMAAGDTPAQQKLNVVATLPTYAAIAREVTGDLANVESIARGDVDPHFVNPRPSYAAMIQRADLFINTGLDLELWVPGLLDRANNQKVVDGAPGNVAAYAGVTLLQVPENVSRTGGDVHVFGNPHIHTDPINAILVARNIAAGLKRVDPTNATTYEANLEQFEDRVIERLVGAEFAEMLGAETIFDLARNYQLLEFATEREFQGRPLISYIGGWLAQAEPFRNQRMACYHRNWAYFSARFRVECAIYVEPKPGIPPTPGHVREVIDFIQAQNINVLWAANYFSRSQVERVGDRAEVPALLVPEHVDGEEGVVTYFDLVDVWTERLSAAFLEEGE